MVVDGDTGSDYVRDSSAVCPLYHRPLDRFGLPLSRMDTLFPVKPGEHEMKLHDACSNHRPTSRPPPSALTFRPSPPESPSRRVVCWLSFALSPACRAVSCLTRA